MEKAATESYRKYFERIALYKSFGYDIEEERKFILEKASPFYGKILEVGSGKGYFTIELVKEGYDFTSIDISPQEQELARLTMEYLGLEKKVDLRIENAEHLNFNDSIFDIVFSVNTIHHFIHPLKVIDELIRVTASGGKIVLSDFNKKGLEIVNKIHHSEGKKHNNISQVTLQKIGVYLRNKGLKTQNYQSAFQDLIITYC